MFLEAVLNFRNRKGGKDEGFSMRATARDFDAGLTLARVDKPLKEEAVGC